MAFNVAATMFVLCYTLFVILSVFRTYVHLQYGLRPFNLGKLFHCTLVVFLIFRTAWMVEVSVDTNVTDFGIIMNRIAFCLFFTCFSVLPLKWAHILISSKPRLLYLNIAALNSVLYLLVAVFSVIIVASEEGQALYDVVSVAIATYSFMYAVVYTVVGYMILKRIRQFPATVTNVRKTVIQLYLLLVICIVTLMSRAVLFAWRPITGSYLNIQYDIWLLCAYVIPDLSAAAIQLFVMRQPVISKAEWETLEEAGSEATITGRRQPRKRRITIVNEIDRLAGGYTSGEWGRPVDDWAQTPGITQVDNSNGDDDEYDSVEMVNARKVSSDEEEDIGTVATRPIRLRGTVQSPLTVLQYPDAPGVTAPYLDDMYHPIKNVRFITVSCNSLPSKFLFQIVVSVRPSRDSAPPTPKQEEEQFPTPSGPPAVSVEQVDVSAGGDSNSGDGEETGTAATTSTEPTVTTTSAPTATTGGSPGKWHELARTEVSVSQANPSYLQLIPIPLSGNPSIDNTLEMRFVVSRVNPSDMKELDPVASMQCHSSDIFTSDTLQFSKPLIPDVTAKITEKIPLSAFITVTLATITDAFVEAYLTPGYTTKCYLFETADKEPLPVMERMCESPFAFPLAYDVLLLRWPFWEERLRSLQDKADETSGPETQMPPKQGMASALGMGHLLDDMKVDLDAQQARQHQQALHGQVKNLMNSYEDMLPLYQSYTTEKKAMQFKPSVYKEDAKLRMVATNLHWQEMLVDRPDPDRGTELTAYPTVTVGAPAAHVYGFKDGGLRQQEERIRKVKNQLRLRRGRSAMPSRGDALEVASLSRRIDGLTTSMIAREDVCIAQSLASLATVFSVTVQDFIKLPHVLETYAHIGFLVVWESLLSTTGDEKGMLGDMATSMKLLKSLHFRLIDDAVLQEVHAHTDALPDDSTGGPGKKPFVTSVQVLIQPGASAGGSVATHGNVGRSSEAVASLQEAARHLRTVSSEPSMSKNPGHQHHRVPSRAAGGGINQRRIILEIAIPSEYFAQLPLCVQNTDIATTLILFTQGINEQQTIANAIGSAGVQSDINNYSWACMKEYYAAYKTYRESEEADDPEVWAKEVSLLQLDYTMDQFESTLRVARSGKKNTGVLTESEDLGRALRAGRLTSCKSAKDRTSMAVTMEQARILHRSHKLPRNAMAGVADVMRSAGVRLVNAFKNTGKEKYAFNSFQRKFLPRMYRPEALAASEGVKT